MKELEKLIELYQSLHLAEIHLQKINERLPQYYMELQELSVVLAEQYDDLGKLEKMGLSKLFSKILRDPKSQYEQKKQEYLLGALRFNECKKMIELLEFEKAILEEKLQTLDTVRAELNLKLKQEKEYIEAKYPSTKETLITISNTLFQNVAYRKELSEAVAVNAQLNQLIKNMIETLKKAKEYENWGYFYKEKQEGKKIKKSYIDQAQTMSYEAKQLFQQLQDELEDSYRFKAILESTGFRRLKNFNKVYNDSLVTDWLAREQVHHTLGYIRETFYSLRTTLEILENQLYKTDKYISHLYEKQKEFLFKSNDQ